MTTSVKFKHNLGEFVKDKVSGFQGTIDARCQWLNGCIRYSVMPKMKEGEAKMPESFWIDEAQIEKVDNGVSIKKSKRGGPVASSSNARF